MKKGGWSLLDNFFSLTPERVLQATERAGQRTTGLCYPLGSLENRVYEIELESGTRVVSKFYRPGRWGAEAIGDEHRLLTALQSVEIPCAVPIACQDGQTVQCNEDGIFFALFPRVGGRSPDELQAEDYQRLGRLLGRMHNVSSQLTLPHRPDISPQTYGTVALQQLLDSRYMSPSAAPRLKDAAQRLVVLCQDSYGRANSFVVHGDCHRGNLLLGREGFFLLDFDDMGRAPAVQDFWLLLPARPVDCPDAVEAMLEGYTQFRAFDRRELGLIEALRGLRYLRYAAWIANRFADPAFARTFNDFGSELYWQRLTNDVYEQVGQLQLAMEQ